jgi:hypothetical protein
MANDTCAHHSDCFYPTTLTLTPNTMDEPNNLLEKIAMWPRRSLHGYIIDVVACLGGGTFG